VVGPQLPIGRSSATMSAIVWLSIPATDSVTVTVPVVAKPHRLRLCRATGHRLGLVLVALHDSGWDIETWFHANRHGV
jgi:hypothetical protein